MALLASLRSFTGTMQCELICLGKLQADHSFYDVIVKLNCQRNVLSELVVEKKDGILDVTN